MRHLLRQISCCYLLFFTYFLSTVDWFHYYCCWRGWAGWQCHCYYHYYFICEASCACRFVHFDLRNCHMSPEYKIKCFCCALCARCKHARAYLFSLKQHWYLCLPTSMTAIYARWLLSHSAIDLSHSPSAPPYWTVRNEWSNICLFEKL